MPTQPDPGHPMRRLIGLSAALATPFDEAGDIDWPRMAAHASDLLDRGMQVVTAFGTTGEGASIGTRARAELFERMDAGGVAPHRLVECIYGPASDDAAWFARRATDCSAGMPRSSRRPAAPVATYCSTISLP